MGYAGNNDPQFIIPSAIATREGPSATSSAANTPRFSTASSAANNLASKRGIEDLDFFIGDEYVSHIAPNCGSDCWQY